MTFHTSQATATMPLQGTPVGAGFGQFFRYHGWLAPGVRLFRSIGFPAKAAWVSMSFLVPLVLMLYFLASAALDLMATTHSELAGMTYVRPVLDYIVAEQDARRADVMHEAGATERQGLAQKTFGAVQARQAAIGKDMGTDKPFEALLAARTAAAAAGTAEPDASFRLHSDAVAAALVLLREISDGSTLALDPDMDTYHMMNIVLLRGMGQVENTARLGSLGSLILSSKQLTPLRHDLLVGALASQALMDADVENSYRAVIEATPEVEAQVDMKGADEATDAFYAAVHKQLMGTEASGDPAAFVALGHAAADKQYALVRRLADRLDSRLQQRIDRQSHQLALEIGIAVVFVLFAAYLMLAFYKVMMGGLREVSGHLDQITQGNLTTAPKPWGRDEAAQLMLALGRMQTSLRRIVGSVLDGSAQVRTASNEISSASLDLSGRTEETAANLEQTAASMEQISATVKHTAHTVEGASSIVRSNAAAATRGGAVIGEVVQTMQGIQASSNKIGEIIGVIDGIAFQTNILALNAAVEAARAGEQGRGFAVVATEVRALAGRSSAAAREIKSLINASIEQVDAGNRVAAEAGTTMTEIVKNAETITGLMNDIATATQEQSKGLSQVGEAVHELDRATQQNAALVEQTSAAAGSLSSQAQRLAEEVGFFKLT